MTNTQAISYFKGKRSYKKIINQIANGFLTWESLIEFVERRKRIKKNELLTAELVELLKEYKLFEMVRIYYNDKCLDSEDGLILSENPIEYFQWANAETLSMSFAGQLYVEFNEYGYLTDFLDRFNGLITKYGYYYEMGDSWNLALFESI